MPRAILLLDDEGDPSRPPSNLGVRTVSFDYPFVVVKRPRQLAKVYEVVNDPDCGPPTVRARRVD